MMKINWQNQTAVITGAYGGLGTELARILKQKGADLVLLGRDEEKLNTLQTELGAGVEIVVGDICADQTSDSLLKVLNQHHNQQHMLINNAATSQAAFLQNQSPSAIRNQLEINLIAPMVITNKLLPWLKQADQAHVVNIGSSFGGIGYPGFSSYCASKFGLHGFTQALNREWSDTHVNAHYLAPRAMSTQINSSAVDRLNAKLGNSVDRPGAIAQQIIRTIEKQQTEKFFGWPEKFFIKINALFPNLVSKAISKDQSTIKTLLNEEVNHEN